MPSQNRPIPALALALTAGLVLPAAEVVVTPGRKTLDAGSPTAFQFHAQAKDVATQPAWVWTVESFGGKTHPPGGGAITQQGAYTPPATAIRTRVYRIRATAANNPSLTGTALVRVHPALGWKHIPSVVQSLGGDLLAPGPRIEFLAGAERRSEAPVDSGVGREARFVSPDQLVAIHRVPWKIRGKEVLDALLVFERASTGGYGGKPHPSYLRLVTAEGGVSTLATFGTPEGEGKDALSLSSLAVRPWNGPGDGEWEAFYWDRDNQTVGRLGADFKAAPYAAWKPAKEPVSSIQSPTCEGLAVDGKGTVYLALNDWTLGQGRAGTIGVVRRGDAQIRILAGGPEALGLPEGGADAKAGLGRLTGLALDPERGLLYSLLATDSKDRWDREVHLVVIDPRDGKVAVRPEPACRAGRSGIALACFRGRVVVGEGHDRTFYLVDPDSGAGRAIYRESRYTGRDISPGPALPPDGRTAGMAGSLGGGFHQFAIDQDGRIVVNNECQFGLLLLDWEQLGLPEGSGGRSGPAAGPASREERKDPKGDSKVGP